MPGETEGVKTKSEPPGESARRGALRQRQLRRYPQELHRRHRIHKGDKRPRGPAVCASWRTCEASMYTPTRRLPWPLPLVLLLLLAPCGLSAERGAAPIPLAVRAGVCKAVLDTAKPAAQFYLILGS